MPNALHALQRNTCSEIGDECIAFNLRRADRLISQIYDGVLRPAGIKGTQFSLMVSMKSLQPVTVSTLAKRMDVDRTTLTRNLSVLEEAALVTYERGEDLRERRLSLTDAGEDTLQRAFPLWKQAQQQVSKVVGEKTMKALVADLRQFASALA